MSGNAPRAANQAVQKEGQERRPTGDATDEPAPQAAPGSGRRLGGSKQEGGGSAEPPKKPVESGAVKTAGVQQGSTKSDPATQGTGKGWLGGKKEGVEKDDQGHQNRERKEDPGEPEKVRPGRQNIRSEEDAAERKKGTGKWIPGRQNSRSERDVAERERVTGNRIPGRQNSRSEEDAAEREKGTGKRIPGRQKSRSEKDVVEREGGTGNRTPGR